MFHEFVNYDTSHNKLFSVGTFGDIQNGPVEITFDKPITNFTLYLWQIAMAGHAMSAYDANGQKIDTVDFAASPDTQQRTLTAPGIRKVYIYKPLTPPTPGVDRGVLDFVYHRAGFEVPCPPTQDPISDEKAFRDKMSAEYQLGIAEERERFVWIYRNPTTFELAFRTDTGTGRDACSVFGTATTPPAVAGLVALASAHTHIIPFNEQVGLRCPGVPMLAKAGNGPSPEDSAKARRSGVRMFIIDENELHILRNDSLFTHPWTRENGCR
jgi:hypothetical protein